MQLAEVGAALDRQEALALGGGALGGESGNVRADGFFSVQARAPSNLHARAPARRVCSWAEARSAGRTASR